MSFQLAEAYVELKQRGFRTISGEIDNVQKKLGGLVSYVQGPMSTAIGTAIGSMGTTILAGLASKLSSAGTGMLKLAADAEQTEVAFTTMLGSADKAKEMIADLTSFASATPFEMPGIKQAARTLLAFGTSQEQVLPLLRVLGDVSAGTGKDLSELAVIFGQISATGKLTGGDLMQLTNAGVPMLATLATQLGKTTGEVKAMVEGGEISANAVTRAFQSMSSDGGLFANMMQKQSGTLAGLWSTFSDNLNSIMLDVGNAFVQGFDLKSIVANMSSFAERFRSEWMPSIVSAFQWTRENIVGPWVTGMGRLVSAVGNLVGAVRSQFERLTAGLKGTTGGFFGWLIEGYYSTWGSIIDSVANFIYDFDLYWKLAYTSVGNSLNNMYQIFKTGLSNMWTTTKWFFGNFGTIAYNTVANIGTIFMNYFKQIRNNWQSLLNFFKTGKLEFDFSPMKESINAILEGVDMPKLEMPQLDALRSDMDRIESQIAKRQADRLNARKKAENQVTEAKENELVIADDVAAVAMDATKQEEKKTDEFKTQTAEQKKQTAEQKKQAAGFVSLADLADQMQQRSLEIGKDSSDANAGDAVADAAGMNAAAGAGGVNDPAAGLGNVQREQPAPAAPTVNVMPAAPQTPESTSPLTSTISEAFVALQSGLRSMVERMQLPSLATPQPKIDLAGVDIAAPAGQAPASPIAGMRDAGSMTAQQQGGLHSDLSQLAAIATDIAFLRSLASGEGLQTRLKNSIPQVGPSPKDWQFGN